MVSRIFSYGKLSVYEVRPPSTAVTVGAAPGPLAYTTALLQNTAAVPFFMYKYVCGACSEPAACSRSSAATNATVARGGRRRRWRSSYRRRVSLARKQKSKPIVLCTSDEEHGRDVQLWLHQRRGQKWTVRAVAAERSAGDMKQNFTDFEKEKLPRGTQSGEIQAGIKGDARQGLTEEEQQAAVQIFTGGGKDALSPFIAHHGFAQSGIGEL